MSDEGMGRVQACHHAPAADEPAPWPEGYRCPICEPTPGRVSSPTSVDDERRFRGIPRNRDTPCAMDDCPATSPLEQVNPKGELGIFMCPDHARSIG